MAVRVTVSNMQIGEDKSILTRFEADNFVIPLHVAVETVGLVVNMDIWSPHEASLESPVSVQLQHPRRPLHHSSAAKEASGRGDGQRRIAQNTELGDFCLT